MGPNAFLELRRLMTLATSSGVVGVRKKEFSLVFFHTDNTKPLGIIFFKHFICLFIYSVAFYMYPNITFITFN